MGQALDRKTETIIGLVFLVGMVITLILAIATFEGTPTIILLITSIFFLGIAVMFLSDGGSGTKGGAGEGAGQGQQQSVVLGNGKTITQSSSSAGASQVYELCPGCETRVQEGVKFCPECGHAMGA